MSSLERLRRGLQASAETYQNAPRPRTDSIKRQAAMQSLDAVLQFIRSQPGFDGLDGQLNRVMLALANVEAGNQSADWLENPHKSGTPFHLRYLKGYYAAEVEFHVHFSENKLSVKDAAQKVFDKIRSTSSLFTLTKAQSKPSWKTVASWRKQIRRAQNKSLEGATYGEALKYFKQNYK